MAEKSPSESRPMLRDVAKAAHVGLATASRALTGKGSIAEESRKRVLRAAKSLGYRPVFGAMSLRGQRPPLIGVVSFFIDAWSQVEMLWGLDAGLWASGHHMLFSPYHSHSPQDRRRVSAWIQDAAAQNLTQGLVVMSDRLLDKETIDFVLERDIPVVTLEFSHPGCRAIVVDNRRGGSLAGEWLAPRCKAFRILAHDSSEPVFLERKQGYLDALHSRKPGNPVSVDLCPGVSFDVGLAEGRRMTLRKGILTGIFSAVGDVAALGLHQGLVSRGYVPGQDFRIVGFDGLPVWRQAGKIFPTVIQPLRQMGLAAAEKMLDAVRRNDPPGPPLMMEPRLDEGGAV